MTKNRPEECLQRLIELSTMTNSCTLYYETLKNASSSNVRYQRHITLLHSRIGYYLGG